MIAGLSDFLLTASADDSQALIEAQSHFTVRGQLIHRDSMNSFLALAGIYKAMIKIAEDDTSPFQDFCAAFLDSTEYNFIDGATTGDAQTAALDQMVGAGITVMKGGQVIDVSAKLAAIKPDIIARANVTSYPFAAVTIEDIQYHRQEVVNMPTDITSESVLTLQIQNSPRQPVNISIQQSFGNDENDLTDWETIANFINVKHHQITYQAKINAMPTQYRKVRIVSPVTLGMSIS